MEMILQMPRFSGQRKGEGAVIQAAFIHNAFTIAFAPGESVPQVEESLDPDSVCLLVIAASYPLPFILPGCFA